MDGRPGPVIEGEVTDYVRRGDDDAMFVVTDEEGRGCAGGAGDLGRISVLADAPEPPTVEAGDTIRYDRGDGQLSEARVERVLEGGVHWSLEATTTENSLRANERIVLTPDRVRNTAEVEGKPGRVLEGGTPPVPKRAAKPVSIPVSALVAADTEIPGLVQRGIEWSRVRPERIAAARAPRSKPGAGERMTRFIKPVLAWWKVDPAVAKTGDYVRLKQHVDNWSGKPIEGRVQEITVGPDDTLVFQVGMVSEVAYPRDIVQVGKPKPGIRDALAQMARQAGFQGETARHERVTVERPARNRLGKSISAYQ